MARTELKRWNNFILYHETGTAMNNTPYESLEVRPIGLAEKHVVDIELRSNVFAYNGEPIKYTYNRVYVKHGFRSTPDTLAETKEYIDVLNEALEVAFDIEKYCVLNGWWNT